jgi:peroxiredoxin
MAEQLGRAVKLLVTHHFNDLAVARAALGLTRHASRYRDPLFQTLYDKATDRSTKGTAALALANYVQRKSTIVELARGRTTPPPERYEVSENGKPKTLEAPSTYKQDYWEELRALDPQAMKRQAEAMYSCVIREFGDVPYARWRRPNAPAPTRKLTLAEAAQDRLDEIHNIVPGKPAPDIDGQTVEGTPLQLSDYRGKVVVLVFWGSWCGPCIAEIPHERQLLERFKDRQFALLGVACDEERSAASKVIKENSITWPNWYDGAPGEGAIAKRYHVRAYPKTIVIDEHGIIRFNNAHGAGVDQAVETLLSKPQ